VFKVGLYRQVEVAPGDSGGLEEFALAHGLSEQEGRARLLDPATEPAPVRAMSVRSDWTRRGLGTRILEACEPAARDEGFTQLSLMATLPGFELYRRYGFREIDRGPITLPDGIQLECASMDKPIDLPA
jgi:GNAT superfamily N-acetyltransferase